MKHQQIVAHFDKIAAHYDSFKTQKPYYYRAIIQAVSPFVKPNSSVLDYGCGTGTITATISAKEKIGYDPSHQMIKIARDKFPKLANNFHHSLKNINKKFDTILLIDVIEHLSSLDNTLLKISKLLKPNGQLIISYVSSTWEPILTILEKLKLKMPEGPHTRISIKHLLTQTSKAKLVVVKRKQVSLFERIPISPITILILEKN